MRCSRRSSSAIWCRTFSRSATTCSAAIAPRSSSRRTTRTICTARRRALASRTSSCSRSRKGCAHVLAYPLLARDRRTGVLVVVRNEGSPGFSPSELRRGTVLANQLTLSIENARLYGELQDGMRELVRAQNDLVQAERL